MSIPTIPVTAISVQGINNYYYYGKGVEQDAVKAFEWNMKAADKGDMQSLVNVANAYYLGDGVEQDHHKAFLWYREAAFQGHVLIPKPALR